ncbi:hypothetical protein BCV69DRAFT_304985 [Microstroma glucosiphilum]|uniref:Uncharacterized protein n=1 Tax=Pseudomicrostroma glucosiphilum TaxID=1684307 RepID=A0A316TXF2_9BASI|nr:hypothetical protein BCV69DRAFT_304985 [Pseudomicrostroma glucosiphilum]PWN18032.1 hypothetical protein BCV69DRAFT_304985 [Pseudomicrostroma glucosiphilum]
MVYLYPPNYTAPPKRTPGQDPKGKKKTAAQMSAAVQMIEEDDIPVRSSNNSRRAAEEALAAKGRPDIVMLAFTTKTRVKGISSKGKPHVSKTSTPRRFVYFKPLIPFDEFATLMAKAALPDTSTPAEDYAASEAQFYIPKAPYFDQGIAIKTKEDLGAFKEALSEHSWKGASCRFIINKEEPAATEAADLMPPPRTPSPNKATAQPAKPTPSVLSQQRKPLVDSDVLEPFKQQILAKWPVCNDYTCAGARAREHCYIDALNRHRILDLPTTRRWAKAMQAEGHLWGVDNPPDHLLDGRSPPRGITRGRHSSEHSSSPEAVQLPATPTTSGSSYVGPSDSASQRSSFAGSSLPSNLHRAFADVTNVSNASSSKRRIVSHGTPPPEPAEPRVRKEGPAMTCLHLCSEGHSYVDDDLLALLAKHRLYEMSILAEIPARDLRRLGFGPVDLIKLQQMVDTWAAIKEPEKHVQPVGKIAEDIRKMKKLAGLPQRTPSPRHHMSSSPEVIWSTAPSAVLGGVFEVE